MDTRFRGKNLPSHSGNSGGNCVLHLRLVFAYNVSMFPTPSGRKTFVVTCKRCRRDVPSCVREFVDGTGTQGPIPPPLSPSDGGEPKTMAMNPFRPLK